MTIQRLIAKLQPIADAAPDTVVLIGRGDGNWYDEVEDVDSCRINRDKDLECGPHTINPDGKEDVVVIH